jgi:integrase
MQIEGDRMTDIRPAGVSAQAPSRTGSATRPSGGAKPTRRRRAFGKVARQRSGRYQASYVGDDEMRHLAPVTFDTKRDADAWLSMRRAELEEHRWRPPDPQDVVTPTLREYAETWIENRRTRDGQPLKPRTMDLYHALLERQIYPALGDKRLADITADDVDDWYVTLLPAAPTRRSHSYALLSSIMRSASTGRRALISDSPCKVEHPAIVRRSFEPRPATPEQIAIIVENMPEKYRALILLAAWCGLRWGEVSELRRSDLDLASMSVRVDRAVVWRKGRPTVGTPKSRAGVRTVALPPNLRSALRRHLAEHAMPGSDGLLFPNAARTGHLHVNTLSKTYHRARLVAGRPDLRFHDLRHSAATMAAQAGATLAELMARMGHSTAKAALVYQHVAEGRDRIIAERMSLLAEPSLIPALTDDGWD